VDYRTFSIDQSQFQTVDKARIGDKLYSSKPPVLSVYGAGVYWMYKQVTGGAKLTKNRGDNAYGTITFFIGFLPHMVLLVFFFLALRHFTANPLAQVFASAGIAAGYIGTLYARIINNHTVAAALLFIALYMGMRIRTSGKQHWSAWVFAGCIAGLLPTIDVPSAAFTAGLVVYLCFVDTRKTLMFFLPALAVPLVAHFAITYAYSGGFLPVQLRGLVLTPDDSAGDPLWTYFYHMMIGHHGLFAYTPLALLGLVETFHQLLSRGKWWRESLLILCTVTILVLYYVQHTNNYGGLAVGFRWLIPILPPLIFFAGVFLDRLSSRRIFPFLCLLFMFLIAINVRHMQREERPLRSPVWAAQYNEQGFHAYPCFVFEQCP